jgi:type IV secretory pathway TraG/TraD family ATPase VirD4
VSKSQAVDRGFYLGTLWDGYLTRTDIFLPHESETNIVVIGPPGAGKTVLLINNAALLKRPKIIIDIKGEISAVMIPALEKENPGSTRVINPWNLLVDQCPYLADSGYGPLIDLKPLDREYIEHVFNFCIGMNASHGTGGQNAFFTDGATSAMAAVIGQLRVEEGEDANLGTFREIITLPYGVDKQGNPIGLFKKFRELAASNCPEIRAQAGRFATGTKGASETLFTAATETTSLDSPALKQSLRGPGIDWQKFKNSVSTISIIIPVEKLNSHRGYLRIMVMAVLRELAKTPPSKVVRPVALMLDEAPQLGHMRELVTAAATARGYGLRFMPMIVQDLNQLHAIYSNAWPTFLSTASCICSFAPRDNFTADYLSDLCGRKIVSMRSDSSTVNGDGTGSVGTNSSLHFQKLFQPYELMAMPPGRMLCLVRDVPPFFTQVPPYWSSKFGRGLAPNPYHAGH